MITIGLLLLIFIPLLIWKPKPTLLVGGSLIVIVGLVFWLNYSYRDRLSLLESIPHPTEAYNICLYEKGPWLSDSDFIVLKIDKQVNPENISNTQQAYHYDELLANYEERNDLATNPDIRLVDKQFLVFSRGGYYFGLYDIKAQKPIVNDCCPFNSWATNTVWTEKGTYYDGPIERNAKSDYGTWVKENIHEKIVKHLKGNKAL